MKKHRTFQMNIYQDSMEGCSDMAEIDHLRKQSILYSKYGNKILLMASNLIFSAFSLVIIIKYFVIMLSTSTIQIAKYRFLSAATTIAYLFILSVSGYIFVLKVEQLREM